jgi:sRNA-binding regulator protein Hfq
VNIKTAQERQPVKTNNITLINGCVLTTQIKWLKKVGVKGSTEINNFIIYTHCQQLGGFKN